MANIRSINEIRRGAAADAAAGAEDGDANALSQGGTTSGTATMRRAAPADLTEAVVRRAQQSAGGAGGAAAAEPLDGSGSAASAASLPSFGRITTYRNGFIIGDGEFRDSSEATNQKILQDLLQGNVPRELESEIRAAIEAAGLDPSAQDHVRIDLVDKRTEDYVAPKPQFRAFQGTGFSLSSEAPAATAAGGAGPAELSTAPAQELPVDDSQPVIQAQVVTATRQRLRVRMNASHTVRQFYQHVRAISGAGGPFSLSAGFPPKVLADGAQTVGDAGLRGASVTQKAL